MSITLFALIAAGLAVGVGFWLFRRVLASPATSPRALEIAGAIRTGAQAFLSRQYRTVAYVGIPLAGVIAFLPSLGLWTAGGFVLGAVASASAGIIGMNVSVRANVRVAEAAKDGFQRAFA
ncbi:MAG TPA: sodium/proton-translocating pyrophosphatase, partial [Myxococcota bacterium]|nr:sodium/proton-translocating pyrophosphatase [Myxococcota bacterium]